MLLTELFFVFLKIGFTSFSGMAMISIINQEMVTHGWLSMGEVADIVGIAEMTPGSLGINCATFVGMRLAGVPGALLATLGVLMPALTVTVIVARCYVAFRDSKQVSNALYGIRPACIGLILAAIVTMRSNLMIGGSYSIAAIGIAVLIGVLMMKWKMSLPLAIGLSAVLGVLFT